MTDLHYEAWLRRYERESRRLTVAMLIGGSTGTGLAVLATALLVPALTPDLGIQTLFGFVLGGTLTLIGVWLGGTWSLRRVDSEDR